MAEEEREDLTSKRARRRADDSPQDDAELEPDSSEADAVDDAGSSDGEADNRRARRAAAAKRRKQRLREREEAEAVGLDAQEIIDDTLMRSTDTAAKWVRRNSSTVQWALVAGIVIWAGWGIYDWRSASADAAATDTLAAALATENGKIGDPKEQGKPNEQNVVDPTPIFKDHAERLKQAEQALEKASAERPGSAAGLFAKLALASVLLDQAEHARAGQLFNEVSEEKLSERVTELKGRALEGLALIAEAKGDKEAALKAYRKLDNAELDGFKELSLLNQTRLLLDLGKEAEAKEVALKLNEKLKGEDGKLPARPITYVGQVARSLSDALGIEPPEEEPQEPAGISPERLKQLQEQLQRQINQKIPTAPPATGESGPGKQDQPASHQPASKETDKK